MNEHTASNNLRAELKNATLKSTKNLFFGGGGGRTLLMIKKYGILPLDKSKLNTYYYYQELKTILKKLCKVDIILLCIFLSYVSNYFLNNILDKIM